MNDDLRDNALKQALRRQPAPDGFAERVLLRIEEQSLAQSNSPRPNAVLRDSWLAFFTQPLVRWAAVAAVAAAMVVGTAEEFHYRSLERERAQGEAAKQQLMLALRIAGIKLQLARSKVNRTGPNPGNANPAHTEQTEN